MHYGEWSLRENYSRNQYYCMYRVALHRQYVPSTRGMQLGRARAPGTAESGLCGTPLAAGRRLQLQGRAVAGTGTSRILRARKEVHSSLRAVHRHRARTVGAPSRCVLCW